MNTEETESVDKAEKFVNCIICGSKVELELPNLFETRFGLKKIWDICRCMDCGMVQTIPISSIEELKILYEEFYNFGGEKGTFYALIRARFFSSFFYRFWLALDGDISFHAKKGSVRLLDIGCNEGRGLRIYKKNGFKAEGLEPNETAATEAKKDGFRIYTEPVEQLLPSEPYDVCVLSNVLEHCLDPKKMLSNVNRILKTGRQVWISCPNVESWQRKVFGRHWINWHVPFHSVHFSQSTLINILKESGFEIQKMKQESPALWFVQSVIVKIFAKFGQPTKNLRKSILVATLMLIAKGLFFPLLFLGNCLGRGDCIVTVAKKV